MSTFASSQSTAFQEAVDAVRSKRLSGRQAANTYGCATTTLYSHVRCVVKYQQTGMHCSRNIWLPSYTRPGWPCAQAISSRFWLSKLFLIRRAIKEVVECCLQTLAKHITIQRAKCCRLKVIDGFFTKLEEVLRNEGLLKLNHSDLSACVWNCDETGLSISVTATKVIGEETSTLLK